MTSLHTTVYWDELPFCDWTFYLAATDAGLCLITLPNETFDTMEAWVTKRLPDSRLQHDASKLRPYVAQLEEYLSGRRKTFSLQLDLRGTHFQTDVWRALLEIPFGQTRSYSQICERIGKPAAVRATGTAIGANPLPIVVPCHRVIGKDGSLTGYRGGTSMKADLLKLESPST